MKSSTQLLWIFLWIASIYLLQSCVVCSAGLPVDDWADGVEKATDHNHWEHIVKKRASVERHSEDHSEDDTSHIVNIQEYYRAVFDEGWEDYEDNEQELFNLLGTLEKIVKQDTLSPHAEATAQKLADVLEFGLHSKPIRGRYIVMFQEGSDDYMLDRTITVLKQANVDSDGRIRATDLHPLRYVGKGFTATLNRKAVDLMSKHPSLAHIEEDTALRRSEVLTQEEDSVTSSSAIPWNLDRIDQHENTPDHQFQPDGDGSDVNIYIIDTGVRASHEEFGGRVHYAGFDAVDYLTGSHNEGEDCNGHGTHCAGTAAGKTYGVAKNANIYNLRALNCEGTGAVSGIVMGIDKIIEHHKEGSDGKPVVISQSLGVKKSESLNGAIKRAVEAGVTMVGAAGNQGSYSCNFSPPSAVVGIAVGATDQRDEVTMFTNTGECTDIMAPGQQIKSASNTCDTCTKTMSGTSMATPHAAGAAAIILSHNPQMSATEVKKKMISQCTKDRVMMSAIADNRAHNTPNRLLYVGRKSDEYASIQGFQSRP